MTTTRTAATVPAYAVTTAAGLAEVARQNRDAGLRTLAAIARGELADALALPLQERTPAQHKLVSAAIGSGDIITRSL